MSTCVEELASLPVAHLYRALLSPSPMHVACNTSGCPKVSPCVAECLLFMIWHFKIVFTPAYCSGPAIVSEVVWLSIFRFKIIECYDQLPISFLSHELMEQLQVWLVFAIDLLILSSPLLSIYWFCWSSFSLTQSIYLIDASIHCSLSNNWYAEAQTKQNKKEEKDLNSV